MALGRFWAALGWLLGGFGVARVIFGRWLWAVSGQLLDGSEFGAGLGRVLDGSGRLLGGSLGGSGRLLGGFWVALGRLWAALGRLWPALERLWAGLGGS